MKANIKNILSREKNTKTKKINCKFQRKQKFETSYEIFNGLKY